MDPHNETINTTVNILSNRQILIYCAVIGTTLSSTCANLVVFVYTILEIKRHKFARRRNILIANLTLCCIALALIGSVTFVEWGTLFVGNIMCPSLTFLGNFFVNAVAINVASMSYERMRHLKLRQRKVSISTLLSFIWIFTFVAVSPTINSASLNTETAKCQKDLILGKVSATVAYEVFRCAVFCIFVSAYLLFEIYNIRTKTNYVDAFKKEQTWNLYQKVQSIKCLYVTSTCFIVSWFPVGIMAMLAKIKRAISPPSQTGKLLYSSSPSFLVGIMVVLMYLYIMVLPVTIYSLNVWSEHKGKFKKRERKREFSSSATTFSPTLIQNRAVRANSVQLTPNTTGESHKVVSRSYSLPDINELNKIIPNFVREINAVRVNVQVIVHPPDE